MQVLLYSTCYGNDGKAIFPFGVSPALISTRLEIYTPDNNRLRNNYLFSPTLDIGETERTQLDVQLSEQMIVE